MRRDHDVETDSDTAECACGALRRASRAITQLYNLTLAPSRLKATQFLILKRIHEAGEVAQSSFAGENELAIETLSRRLAALKRKGFIQLRRRGSHGERIYTLTERGKATLAEARPHWERAQFRLKSILGQDDWQYLLRFSERVVDASHDAEQLRIRNHSRRSGIISNSAAGSPGSSQKSAPDRPARTAR